MDIIQKEIMDEEKQTESGSDENQEGKTCDCCKQMPMEIIDMHCMHNICVKCTLEVSFIILYTFLTVLSILYYINSLLYRE